MPPGFTYTATGGEGDGVVTYGEAYTVQPFANTVNLADLTGAQVITALQQQVSGANEASPKILQISKGLTYTLDLTKTGAESAFHLVISVVMSAAFATSRVTTWFADFTTVRAMSPVQRSYVSVVSV